MFGALLKKELREYFPVAGMGLAAALLVFCLYLLNRSSQHLSLTEIVDFYLGWLSFLCYVGIVLGAAMSRKEY